MQELHKIIILVTSCVAISLLILWNLTLSDDRLLEIEPQLFSSVLNVSDKLFDLKLKYVQNSELCNNKSEKYFAVFIVTSYFANVETRSAMRRAFSNEDLNKLGLRRVFLLGTTDNNIYVTQAAIENEAKRFGDIVQGNFVEAYRNLTYKHIMGLKWASLHCKNVKYVIKMDDDIVVDVKQFTNLLKNLKLPTQNYILGYVLRGLNPIREPKNKWYVTSQEYELSNYPTFVSGWLYVTTPQMTLHISSLSDEYDYFWIDDVFVTGILARKLKIRHLNINRFFAVHAELMLCCLKDLPDLRCDYLIGPNGGDSEMFYNFNRLAEKCIENKCPFRDKPLNKTCIVVKNNDDLSHGNAVVESYRLS